MVLIEDSDEGSGCSELEHGGPSTSEVASCSSRPVDPWVRVAQADLVRAVSRLALVRPDLSAKVPLWRWQRQALGGLALALVIAMVLAPAGLAVVLTLVLAVPFFSVYLLRFSAIFAQRARSCGPGEKMPRTPLVDADCPTYAVLVPLYDEAEIVPGLIKALSALDYPVDRLAIRLVVEEDDPRTHAALSAIALPRHMSVLVVPRGVPKTKPRALVAALEHTPGELVVVFDAEDLPEPNQLRVAASAFAHAPQHLVCLQACLNTFNPDETWLTRQFTIEYSALFDLILPALLRFGLPLPLGGTSNHFRRAALQDVLAWDPYNVTEDADLGVRIARFGMRVGVIGSTTWEEAPPTFRIWLGQRTRWLKGWMQTYLVHMRAPRRLVDELGWWPFVGLQVLMGAMIASALVHPWFYILLGYEISKGTLLAGAAAQKSHVLLWLALANLVLGYVSVLLIGAVAVWRRGRRRLITHLPLVPFYWLAISLAGYRALIELVTSPFHWEKTRHRAWPDQPTRGR
ncbi:MAG TPA: glycosyltransferase [Hyphomicrobiaceae bacterium]|nr:glycosyltransferase [Hyphomicrobiaceae bacterium]